MTLTFEITTPAIEKNLADMRRYWEGVDEGFREVAVAALREIETAQTQPNPMCDEDWAEYFDRLSGPEGCDFKEGSWLCGGGNDKSKSTAILVAMGYDEAFVGAVHLIVDIFGGHCDCEILFNAMDKVTP